MRDFTWEVFSCTGDVELYLLYKEIVEHDLQNLATGQTPDQNYESDPI